MDTWAQKPPNWDEFVSNHSDGCNQVDFVQLFSKHITKTVSLTTFAEAAAQVSKGAEFPTPEKEDGGVTKPAGVSLKEQLAQNKARSRVRSQTQ